MRNVFTLLLFALSIGSTAAFAQQKITETILFDTNHAHLSDSARSILDKACAGILVHDLVQIALIGHTDATGSSNYNLALSERRAKAGLQYLISKGISKDKIRIKYFGENNPIALNSNEQGKRSNRRVEIVIEIKNRTSTDIYSLLSKDTQKLTVSADTDIKIMGAEGTVITILQGSLVDAQGEAAKGEVAIELQEFYKKADIVSANLHTMSYNRMLETGGMINITAMQDGKMLEVKKGEQITIAFASDIDEKEMQTFIGVRGEEGFTWVPEQDTVYYYEEIVGEIVSIDNDISISSNNGISNSSTSSIETTQSKAVRDMDKIVLKSGQLGWINCDRFYRFRNRTELKIDVDSKFNPSVRLIFKDLNAVMPAVYKQQNDFIFDAVPVGRKATIVAFGILNDSPYYVSKDIVIGENHKENLTLLKTTMAELKQELKKLN